MAYFGGTYERMVGRAVKVVTGVTSGVIISTMRKVGWWEDEHTGKLVYDPMSVIDTRKFKPAARYAGGLNLGPTQPEPAFVVGAAKTAYYTMDELEMNRTQMIASECLKTAFPQIVPQSQSKRLKMPRKNQHPDGCILKAEDFVEMEKQRLANEAAAEIKKREDDQKKAAGDQAAKDNCSTVFAAVCRCPCVGVQNQSGQMLSDILRTMGLPFSTGSKVDKASRVIAGMPGYLEAAVQAGAR